MNSEKARELALKIAEVAAEIAETTASKVDDVVVEAFRVAITNDLVWAWAWGIIGPKFESNAPILVVQAAEECPAEVKAAVGEAGIDPSTLLLIIQAVMAIIELFRKRA